MRKKELYETVAKLQMENKKLEVAFSNFKEDAKSRDELIRTNFNLGLKNKELLKELNGAIFSGVSFYEVKRQIKNFDFTNMEAVLLFIDKLKCKENLINQYGPKETKKSTKNKEK